MILDKSYSKDEFNKFIKEFLPDYERDERSVRVSDKSTLIQVTQLGTSTATNLTVLDAECEGSDAGKRIAITQDTFKVLRAHGIRNAIVAFHNGGGEWRLSLLTSTLEIKDGKVLKKDSNPRRYSYLLGPTAKTVTPYKYLIQKGPVKDLEQLRERFSVEVVNKQFYASIAELFTKLVGGERGATKYPGLLKINGSISQNVEHQEFAVRLIGRVIFCWFLKEKKSTNGVPIVPDQLLSLQAIASNQDYYHSVLETLFFELLNTKTEMRHEALRAEPYNTVPYLNGGLFSPQYNDYYTQNSYLGTGTPGLTSIPDSWFKELFEILEQYNFTVDENTSYDVDLSIDPEMLGRIFENLLAEINPETGETARKSTGSFYTPREIVEYMVDSSLFEFLKDKTNIEDTKLKALISWGQEDDDMHPLSEAEKDAVVQALSKLTILDPACGSGAYPIGILQKVVYVLQQVDEKAERWLQNQLEAISSPELRRDIEDKYRNGNYDYLRKLGVIRESIFGVDIQSIATEISKLRCFLTLIIDEDVIDGEYNRGVRALPNLDFKFVTANSLISLPEEDGSTGQTSLLEDTSHIDALRRIRDDYFNAPNNTREELKNRFYRLQKQMFETTINRFYGNVSSRYSLLSSWDPFEHKATEWFDSEWMFGIKAFNIVIGNPPYVQLQKNGGELADLYKNEGYYTFARTGDIYSLFYERGLNLSKPNEGLLCYITSNKWMRAGYGEKTRTFLASRNPIKLLDFGGFKVFESATVDTNILLVKNGPNEQRLQATHFEGDYQKGGSLEEYHNLHSVDLSNLSSETWFIGNAQELSLKQKIEKMGTRLKDWDIKIYRGVLTGCNEAFIIDQQTKNKLISQDKNSADIIKPLLRGKDIKRYKVNFKDQYILATGYDLDVKNKYPAIYNYIKSVGDAIDSGEVKVKGKGVFKRDDQGKDWWNLRACDYYDDFEKAKIAWSDIAKSPSFVMLQPGDYFNNTAYMISGDDLSYLLGVLNSNIIKWFFPLIATDLGSGGARYFKQFVEIIPIPKITLTNQSITNKIIQLVDQTISEGVSRPDIDNQLNQLVYQLYDLTVEEIAIIENESKKA